MKFIVCGGRDYEDWKAAFAALDALHAKCRINCIIQGGAKGADSFAMGWAITMKVQYKTYEADWKTHGKRAGPLRNRQMLEQEKPDGVVALPGGRGTSDMITQAERAGVKVWKPYG